MFKTTIFWAACCAVLIPHSLLVAQEKTTENKTTEIKDEQDEVLLSPIPSFDALSLDPPTGLNPSFETTLQQLANPKEFKIAECVSPFEFFRALIDKPEFKGKLLSPIHLDGSLFSGYQPIPLTKMPNGEIAQAISRFGQLPPSALAYLQSDWLRQIAEADEMDPSKVSAEQLQFMADSVDPDQLVAKFKRQTAANYLYRARLLYGTGNFDLAESDYKKAALWQEFDVAKAWNQANKDALGYAEEIDEKQVKDAIASASAAKEGDSKAIQTAFDLLVRCTVRRPNNSELLSALAELCSRNDFNAAFHDVNAEHKDYDSYRKGLAEWNVLESSKLKILLECGSRLSIEGKQQGIRIRAQQRLMRQLNLAIAESKKLVEFENATAEDWYIHASNISQASFNSNEPLAMDERTREIIAACDKSLSINDNFLEAILLRADAKCSQLEQYNDNQNKEVWKSITQDLKQAERILESNGDAYPLGTSALFQLQAAMIQRIEFKNVDELDGVPNDSKQRLAAAKTLLLKALESLPANELNVKANLESQIEQLERQLSGPKEEPLPLPLPDSPDDK